MPIWVKICGIRDVAIAKAACEAGASAIGLVFAESPRRVSIPIAREIAAALPKGVEKIGVFKGQTPDEIRIVLAEVNLDGAQLHCDDGMIPDVDFGVELIPAFPAHVLSKFSTRGMGERRYVLDSPEGAGTGRAWDFAKGQPTTRGQRMILAGGLRPDNVALAIEQASPWGVDVSSGVEIERGVKDIGLIKAFIANARKSGGSGLRKYAASC